MPPRRSRRSAGQKPELIEGEAVKKMEEKDDKSPELEKEEMKMLLGENEGMTEEEEKREVLTKVNVGEKMEEEELVLAESKVGKPEMREMELAQAKAEVGGKVEREGERFRLAGVEEAQEGSKSEQYKDLNNQIKGSSEVDTESAIKEDAGKLKSVEKVVRGSIDEGEVAAQELDHCDTKAGNSKHSIPQTCHSVNKAASEITDRRVVTDGRTVPEAKEVNPSSRHLNALSSEEEYFSNDEEEDKSNSPNPTELVSKGLPECGPATAGPFESSTRVADYNEEDMVLRAQMKAAALEQDSDDEDEDWAPGGFHPAALPRQAERNVQRQAFSRLMQRALQPGLDIAMLQEEMEACKAVKTKLFPHQRAALAWCVNHEKTPTDGIVGGLLADDMGLGKSLVVISLILTNFHDDRPLVKPELGFTRQPFCVNFGGGKGKVGLGWKPKGSQTAAGNVGKKVKKASGTCVFNRFGDEGAEEDKENRFSFGLEQRKPSRRNKFINDSSEDEEDESDEEGSLKDFIADDDESEDESNNRPSKKSFRTENRLKAKNTVTETSDEEEVALRELSQSHRRSSRVPSLKAIENDDEKLNPKLNLDGFMTDSDSDDNEAIKKKNKGVILDASSSSSSGEDEEPIEKPPRRDLKRRNPEKEGDTLSSKKFLISKTKTGEGGESDVSLPDMDDEGPPAVTLAEETGFADIGEAPEETDADDQNAAGNPAPDAFAVAPGVQLIVPPRIPAKLEGRRRATLLVCPTSLISHWVEQLNIHLLQGVHLRLKIHHGQSKAQSAGELEVHDLVITTYGILAAEFTNGEISRGPLLNTLWLRVVLDEGHQVKNHLGKAHKAALQLNVERKWVVSGTPIQNNLMEFWSVLNFLGSNTYGGRENMKLYRRQIEKLCQRGDERGYQRLKVLMDAIALRRNKTDKKPDGSPLVALPNKTILVRDVELSEDERICYGFFQDEARGIVAKLDFYNELLRNYASVLTMMMHLRQLCCHRELVAGFDFEDLLKDKAKFQKLLAQHLKTVGVAGEAVKTATAASEEERQLVAQLRQMIKDGVTDDCSVCLEYLKSPVITPCAHVFCKTCIETVLDTVVPPSCPLCRRTPISKNQLLEAGHQEDAEVEDNTLADMEDIVVSVSSTKVNAVLKEITRIARDRPGDKIVVVSQFTSFLNILQPLLYENHVGYTRIDGSMSFGYRSDVLKHFKTTGRGAPKVLLLSLMAGGVGLNLTTANHLLLLDPAWNPAIEEQCFDRIHRIGQTKETFIYKFITKNSIEEKMVAIQNHKKQLITGAFHIGNEERRVQRIADIRNIFDLN